MFVFKLTLLATALGLLATIALAGACTTDLDCSLAGTCDGGVCHCQPWVTGPNCEQLNFVPEVSASAITATVQPIDGYARWGGSVVFHEGQYHMISAEMADKCSLGVWTFKSQVIHSVSDSPVGPFKRVGIAIGPEAHNPVLSRAVDGTWLIWTCGCPNPTPPKDCSHQNFLCNGNPASWTTTVYSSQSLAGPWEPHVDVLGNMTKGRLGSQNVSPIMNSDGSVDLMFKGPDNNTEASIAHAPNWKGPFTLTATNVFAKYYAANITNEDVYWWRSLTDGYYHALSHRMTPADRESIFSGGHAFAKDLTQWSYALTPAYGLNVSLQQGGDVMLQRRERPQLFFDNNTGLPAVLYNGAQLSRDVFTFAQRLQH